MDINLLVDTLRKRVDHIAHLLNAETDKREALELRVKALELRFKLLEGGD